MKDIIHKSSSKQLNKEREDLRQLVKESKERYAIAHALLIESEQVLGSGGNGCIIL